MTMKIDRRLAFIARMNAEELRGWLWAAEADGRDWEPGEWDALRSRAIELGVDL